MNIIVVLVVAISAVQGFKPKCSNSFDLVVSPDCRSLYQCIGGMPLLMPSCLSGQVFSRKYKVCVRENSDYDDCSETLTVPADNDEVCGNDLCKNGGTCTSLEDDKSFFCACPPTHTGRTCETAVVQSLSVSELCAANSSLVMPHPTECQLYYNCSHTYQTIPRYFEQHMQECTYPMLFSDLTLSCQAFEEVSCGTRTEYKSACDYRSKKCPVAHCYPCDLAFPSCVGLPDGIYAHPNKAGSPEFMECQSERTIETGTCPIDKETSQQTFVKDGKCSL